MENKKTSWLKEFYEDFMGLIIGAGVVLVIVIAIIIIVPNKRDAYKLKIETPTLQLFDTWDRYYFEREPKVEIKSAGENFNLYIITDGQNKVTFKTTRDLSYSITEVRSRRGNF